MGREKLSKDEARRIALAAQGFGVAKRERSVTMRDVQAVTSRLAQFQIDSINVVTRAHFMPLFSRLGPYDPACWNVLPINHRVGSSSIGATLPASSTFRSSRCSGSVCSRAFVTSGLEWSESRNRTPT